MNCLDTKTRARRKDVFGIYRRIQKIHMPHQNVWMGKLGVSRTDSAGNQEPGIVFISISNMMRGFSRLSDAEWKIRE